MSEGATEPSAAKIVWFELPATDTERARGFYAKLFGWHYQPFEGQDYHMSYEAGGAIFAASEASGPIVYFGVDDVDAAVARVEELGGERGEKQEIPGIGFYALVKDSEGNPIGLYQNTQA